jgi:hypothetical protein
MTATKLFQGQTKGRQTASRARCNTPEKLKYINIINCLQYIHGMPLSLYPCPAPHYSM